MHNDDAAFSALMDRLGERLKLAAHMVRGKRIVGPADIEGHRGPDGKFYLVDLARMFPVRLLVKDRAEGRGGMYVRFSYY